jgi:hypothetical protein
VIDSIHALDSPPNFFGETSFLIRDAKHSARIDISITSGLKRTPQFGLGPLRVPTQAKSVSPSKETRSAVLRPPQFRRYFPRLLRLHFPIDFHYFLLVMFHLELLLQA